MSIIINECEVLSCEEMNELNNILNLYINNYPDYLSWVKEKEYYENENKLRHDYIEYTLDKIHLGFLIKNKLLILADNFITFMYLRFKGLQSCIDKQNLYLENNKREDTCNEQKYLEFYKKELEKIESLICEYDNNKNDIELIEEKKIEFVKLICEVINWGFEDINISCEKLLKTKLLHPKTFGVYKQRILGSKDTEFTNFRDCNKHFEGIMLRGFENKANIINNVWISICNKAVEHNILLNKYSTLSSYYKKAPFIRFFLLEELIMPHRYYPQIKKKDMKGMNIGTLNFGKFKFKIHKKDFEPGKEKFLNKYFIFYDKDNYIINPPLLRNSITITYTEFRDLLCYINLPVFRSTVNRNILFFPNYDLHQRLLEIQGLSRNYVTYTGRNIDWKWFIEGEKVAKEAINCFCQEYEESECYGIEPVEYVWYDIVYPDSSYIKKFIFLVVPFEDLDYYTGSDIYKRDGKYYICNKDEVPEHMVSQLSCQAQLERVDYKWFREYLFLVIPIAEEIKYKDRITAFTNKECKIYHNLAYFTKPYPINRVPWMGLRRLVPIQKKSLYEKYIKYKIKYLNLKKLLQKIEK